MNSEHLDTIENGINIAKAQKQHTIDFLTRHFADIEKEMTEPAKADVAKLQGEIWQLDLALFAIHQARQGTQHSWEPVEDGNVESVAHMLFVDGDRLITYFDASRTYYSRVILPDDIRLCRRTPQPTPPAQP